MYNSYRDKIINRGKIRFITGFIARIPRYISFKRGVWKASRNGAKLGKNVCLFVSFANQLNKNIRIGNNVSISRCTISSNQFKLDIGDNVIIGNDVEIIMSGHDIDNPQWPHIRRSEGLIIEDYVWICPHSIILPSVKRIGRGAVIGAGSVVVKDVEPMAVMSGNPAKELRKRTCVHDDLCVESLLGGDLITYCKTWLNR